MIFAYSDRANEKQTAKNLSIEYSVKGLNVSVTAFQTAIEASEFI